MWRRRIGPTAQLGYAALQRFARDHALLDEQPQGATEPSLIIARAEPMSLPTRLTRKLRAQYLSSCDLELCRTVDADQGQGDHAKALRVRHWTRQSFGPFPRSRTVASMSSSVLGRAVYSI